MMPWMEQADSIPPMADPHWVPPVPLSDPRNSMTSRVVAFETSLPGPDKVRVEGSQTSVAHFPAIVHLIWGPKEFRSCQCQRPRLVDFGYRNNEHFRIFHRLRSEYFCFIWMNVHSSWSRYPSHPVTSPLRALFGLSSFKVRTTSRLKDIGFGTHRSQELGQAIPKRSSNIHVLHQIDLQLPSGSHRKIPTCIRKYPINQ